MADTLNNDDPEAFSSNNIMNANSTNKVERDVKSQDKRSKYKLRTSYYGMTILKNIYLQSSNYWHFSSVVVCNCLFIYDNFVTFV